MPHKDGRKSSREKSSQLEAKGEESAPDAKSAKIVIRNLSFQATEDEIEDHFLKFGDIREVVLLRKPDGRLLGCGFVQFVTSSSAEEAIKECDKQEFMGRRIRVAWAIPKAEYIASQVEKRKSKTKDKIKNKAGEEECLSEEKSQVSKWENCDEATSRNDSQHKRSNKKGRIIVRNLSFKITEELLQKHFEKFGEVVEVKLLRQPDGRLVGCGFLEFETRESAMEAIQKANGSELLGRPIICDWSLPKAKYLAVLEAEKKVASEGTCEDRDCKDIVDNELEMRKRNGDGDGESQGSVLDGEVKEHNFEGDEDEGCEYNSVDDKFEDGDDSQINTSKKTPKTISNDVSQGCTVFVKNVPFSATNEDLKACMEQFGQVVYALICIDSLTEHSKGTAFVKFKEKGSAEKCISSGGELELKGQELYCFAALNKEDLLKKNTKEKPARDSRHLYLIKEGVVIAGSPASLGVSATDMAKRLQIEQWKSQMLRNLNMFISTVRLAVHNLPPTWNDAQVKNMFLRYAGKGAVITEARIMRDRQNVDANGVGASKGMAFVRFTTHEHALQALRNINNNPDIFTKAQRPIVSFSIENKAIHKVKQQRELKSRLRNPLYHKSNVNEDKNVAHTKASGAKLRKQGKRKGNDNYYDSEVKPKKNKMSGNIFVKDADTVNVEKPFAGMVARPGDKKLRTVRHLKSQLTVHSKTKKHNQKAARTTRILSEPLKQPRQKQGTPKEEADSFNKLVNKYKSKLSHETPKKWFE